MKELPPQDWPKIQEYPIFPVDTYVVFISRNGKDDPKDKDIPTGYCYQLREASSINKFRIYKDCTGHSNNGYSGPDSKILLRLATPEEEAEYKRVGKPYDVTTLPQIKNNYQIY